MKRHIRLLLSLAALLILLLAAISKPAGADGIALPVVEGYDAHEADVEMPAQKAILVYDEESQREDLILSVELRGGPEAAWVVPVPSLPEVETARPKWVDLLTQRPYYVTKLRNERLFPLYLTEDICFEQSASDEPYRMVVYETRYQYADVTDTAEPSSEVSEWMMVGLALALLGVLAGLGFVWRRRSRPKPGKEV